MTVERLYLVTRGDLPAGARAAQCCHALREFARAHPVREAAWYAASNALVLLETPDEAALAALVARAGERGVACAAFREPDLGDALTAIALAPEARPLVRRLPLALAAPQAA